MLHVYAAATLLPFLLKLGTGKFLTQPTDVTIKVGDSVLINCKVESGSDRSWYINGIHFPSENNLPPGIFSLEDGLYIVGKQSKFYNQTRFQCSESIYVGPPDWFETFNSTIGVLRVKLDLIVSSSTTPLLLTSTSAATKKLLVTTTIRPIASNACTVVTSTPATRYAVMITAVATSAIIIFTGFAAITIVIFFFSKRHTIAKLQMQKKHISATSANKPWLDLPEVENSSMDTDDSESELLEMLKTMDNT